MNTRRTDLRRSREESRGRIVTAATELVRGTSYASLTVDDVMREAGFGRTIFYRHFDDLADLFVRAGREPVGELLAAQQAFADAGIGDGPDVVRAVIAPAVAVYERHGPLLRAIAEAAADDDEIAAGQEAFRERFYELIETTLVTLPRFAAVPRDDVAETGRALNILNESYLLDSFGREPRVSADRAARTLVGIWEAVIGPLSVPEA
jgi:TetR/AcrR family transcriptional regulator, ethionamide resistance regulator